MKGEGMIGRWWAKVKGRFGKGDHQPVVQPKGKPEDAKLLRARISWRARLAGLFGKTPQVEIRLRGPNFTPPSPSPATIQQKRQKMARRITRRFAA